jgi:putative transposase
LKNEAVANGSPLWTGPLRTEADVEEVTFDWVVWYSNERLHSSLGYVPPEEYEQNYYAENIGPSTAGAANKKAA